MSEFDQNLVAREKLNSLAKSLVNTTAKLKRLAEKTTDAEDLRAIAELNGRAGAYAQEMMIMGMSKDALVMEEVLNMVELVERFIVIVDDIEE